MKGLGFITRLWKESRSNEGDQIWEGNALWYTLCARAILGLVCDECPFLAANWHEVNKFNGEERTAGVQLRGRMIIRRPLEHD